jgi:predicted PurR-regulated permease PerM
MNQITSFLDEHQLDSSQILNEADITSKINFILIFLNTIVNTVSSLGVAVGSILFITFFFLKDRLMFIEGAKKLIPDSHEEILNSLDKINNLLSRYFIGLLLQLFIVFILYMIVLIIFWGKTLL